MYTLKYASVYLSNTTSPGFDLYDFFNLKLVTKPGSDVSRQICYINPRPYQRSYDFSGRVNPQRLKAIEDLLCQKKPQKWSSKC